MSENNMAGDEQLLLSLPKAAKMLDLSTRSVRRHFDLVKIGGAVRVRVADIQKKIDSKGLSNHAA
jgi:predicted ArsR family transcriptional regulator